MHENKGGGNGFVDNFVVVLEQYITAVGGVCVFVDVVGFGKGVFGEAIETDICRVRVFRSA